MNSMEAHSQSDINDTPAALLMTAWIIQTGWKILTHVGIQNLYCQYNFFHGALALPSGGLMTAPLCLFIS